MTLLDEYKQKVFETLKTTYNGKIDDEWLKNYVNDIVERKTAGKKLVAHCRNLYKYEWQLERDPNTIPLEIEKDKLNILANGTLTENWNPASYFIITDWMDSRAVFKKKMLEAKNAGNMDDFREYNNKQNKVKANTNSIYGASTMVKTPAFISNVDMGGSITAQARNFISEQVFTIERFLASNFTFENTNEIMTWLNQLFKIKEPLFTKEALSIIDYIPTPDDCRTRFILITKDVIGIRKSLNKFSQSSFLMFEMMPDWKRIAFYYANNPIELIRRNKTIYDLVNRLIENGIEFINPYEIPEGMKSDLELLTDYMKIFSFATIINYNRVEKYKTRKRKCCVVGDTDSTMPSLYEIVLNTLKIYGKENLMNDMNVQIRMTMIFVSLVTSLLDECCHNYVECCNSYHPEDKFFMYMKNEFFFPIILLFPVKKNYIGIQTIQEGKMIPEDAQLAITGRSLGSSGLNEYVSTHIIDLLQNMVLRADKYDPVNIIHGVHEIEDHIEKSIREGDKTFGIFTRYNGINNIKDPERTAAARASCIWNLLYTDDYIVPGDAVYMFDTNLMSEQDLERIDPKFNDIKEKIRKNVFRVNSLGMDFSSFGLKAFAIPVNGNTKKLPEWIIPFIRTDSMIQKHLQPITSLYSSLLLSPARYQSEGSSTKKMGTSTLIRF